MPMTFAAWVLHLVGHEFGCMQRLALVAPGLEPSGDLRAPRVACSKHNEQVGVYDDSH